MPRTISPITRRTLIKVCLALCIIGSWAAANCAFADGGAISLEGSSAILVA
jgi:hypothetical protein